MEKEKFRSDFSTILFVVLSAGMSDEKAVCFVVLDAS